MWLVVRKYLYNLMSLVSDFFLNTCSCSTSKNVLYSELLKT